MVPPLFMVKCDGTFLGRSMARQLFPQGMSQRCIDDNGMSPQIPEQKRQPRPAPLPRGAIAGKRKYGIEKSRIFRQTAYCRVYHGQNEILFSGIAATQFRCDRKKCQKISDIIILQKQHGSAAGKKEDQPLSKQRGKSSRKIK